jgi:type I restriction enzyme R subunit
MLDTGIDIPEVVNLVFFKLVRSKTTFWQMLGRGTRLRPDLFGPGQHKKFFYIFDYCQNLEFFSQNAPVVDGALGESLNTRLFKARLGLITALDKHATPSARTSGTAGPPTSDVASEDAGAAERSLRQETAALLRSQVAAMHLENFVVRPHRRVVERYANEDAWESLTDEQVDELGREVASLPTTLVDDDEEAKRFDMLMLRLQLAVLHVEPGFARLRDQVREIVGMLEDQSSSPMVRDQLVLIEAVAGEEWWQDVTVTMLEVARKRLRALIKLIEKAKRKPVYTDFEDQLGSETEVTLTGFASGTDPERFRAKARSFLKAHEDHITIHKLRRNLPLTATDLAELERMMLEAGVGTPAEIARAKEENNGLGVFIRSLVGLDREAAKEAFSAFLSGGTASANQIEFINMIVDHLTERGVMEPAMLYESPFIDKSPTGPEGLFSPDQVERMMTVLRRVQETAAA